MKPACAAALALLAVACTRTPEPPAAVGPDPDRAVADATASLVDTEWELARLGSASPAPGTRATLQFDADRLGGYGSCNWYGATWTLRDGAWRIGQVESNARGCADPAMAQESALFAALPRVASARRAGERLQLVDANGATLLEWMPRDVAAMDPAALPGTRWRWRVPSPDGVPPVWLAFVDARTFRGFAGCREFSGTWRARGDRLGFDSLTMADTGCSAGAAANKHEERFLSAIGEIETWVLAGDTLTLRTVDGETVEFVREP